MMIHLSSPHIHGGDSVRMTMLSVIFALMPAAVVSVYLFGWLAFLLITVSIFTCVATEFVALRLMGRPATPIGDGSAALTGLLLALTLPAYLPWWMVVLASVIAIMLAKQLYGGLGYNLFNPALAARVILLVSFPLNMTAWIIPMHVGTPVIDLYDFNACLNLLLFGPEALNSALDAITMATPLGHIKTEWSQGVAVADALRAYDYSYLDAFLGREAGSIGETSALALLLGGIYLLARHTISWHIPLSYLATVLILAAIFNLIDPNHYAPPLFHLLAGGLMLCAFFMATDPVSSPVTPLGQIVFGIGCGVLTWSIRTYGGYPEGAMFAVILMNCTVPLIDHYFRPRVYGRSN
ncbi:MAG TPA: RnfABCDGE type electron transport complex subunit D [Mariprofundaceae bacterium]|nr:RnfABCDGE type electron transport complex subunit D [Mariprofundaceae bacterium]